MQHLSACAAQLVAAGAEGGDSGPTLNPAHGVASGPLGRGGAAPYRLAAGGAGGAAALTLDARGALSLCCAHFGASRGSLLQATWRPAPRLALAATALHLGVGGDCAEAPPGCAAAVSAAACCALRSSATLAGWLATALPGGQVEWALSLAPAPPEAGAPPRAAWGIVLGRPLGENGACAELFAPLGARGGDGWAAVPSLTLHAGGSADVRFHASFKHSL